MSIVRASIQPRNQRYSDDVFMAKCDKCEVEFEAEDAIHWDLYEDLVSWLENVDDGSTFNKETGSWVCCDCQPMEEEE